MTHVSVGVVGGGIVGLAVARHLAASSPGCAVTVLEKETSVGQHQSGRNSGVVHAGIYYEPGSLKAFFCRRGAELLRAYCGDHGIDYHRCGKVVVALADSERSRLTAIKARAESNGVPDIRLVDRAELLSLEPHAAGVAALHSPSTSIVDYPAVCRAMASDIEEAGGTIRTGFVATSIDSSATGVTVLSGETAFVFDHLVVCAGLQSDRVARLAGDESDPVIVPFRGEYYRLRPERSGLVRGMIYPVPDPRYPFLGVHLTRRVDGTVDVGPNAVLALAREGYRWRSVRPGDVWETARAPGFRSFARAHWRAGLFEMSGSVSKQVFIRRAQQYVPELRAGDVVRSASGVRAQALAADGTMIDDFRIHQVGRVTAIRNAPSPAATSSLAIAEYIGTKIDV